MIEVNSNSREVNQKLGFFDPVTYKPKPGLLATKSLSTKLSELADDFFSYGRIQNRAFVTKKEDKTLCVKVIECQSPAWKTAVKIALLFTPLAPIMLAIKLISRCNKKFQITDSVALKDRNKFEHIRYENHSKVDLSKIEKHYSTICKNGGIEYEKASPLQKHVLFFTNLEGNITQPSFQEGLERLGASKFTSFLVSTLVFKGVTKQMNITNGVIPLAEIAKGTHPASTGVFNKDGSLNWEKFEDLKSKYPSIDPNYLTADDIVKMRKVNFEKDAAQEGADFGKTAALGEFTLALNLFSDCAAVDLEGNVQPSITLDRLQKVYKNGPELFEEVSVR